MLQTVNTTAQDAHQCAESSTFEITKTGIGGEDHGRFLGIVTNLETGEPLVYTDQGRAEFWVRQFNSIDDEVRYEVRARQIDGATRG
jgi:hypothetical protein